MKKYKVSINETSNKFIVKFETNFFLTNHQNYEYNNIDDALNSPLAQQLFYLPFVKKIYISSNFIAIERYNIVEWNDVQNEVAEQIENYLNEGKDVVNDIEGVKKTAVTVYAESTPNPSAMKFVSNKNLVNSLFEFTSIDQTSKSPLARGLFNFAYVKGVFIEKNYISITKYEIAVWEEITMELREFIRSHIEDGKPIVELDSNDIISHSEDQKTKEFDKLDDISKEIINILEEYVKPAVAADGGNIQFKSYDADTKKVSVILQGACSGCPSSTFTLKNGIENMLKEMLAGKVDCVEAING
ncbi:NifU family protein [Flavobacteriaceae bacterium]|jgi:Fe-S cluster biogenesis protein NfuA|nr:NifU family protein [Flavobacteriaceae bacterium]MDA9572583.1 NifU family protein [Flavobacteriaceae bacterium]MDB4179600.1 NifU family protein [Flavobacteriaceae bacterium]MDC1320490.1 NifU family protein [Flavobacteriaceae bacterium]